jgi:hypothetical protein
VPLDSLVAQEEHVDVNYSSKPTFYHDLKSLETRRGHSNDYIALPTRLQPTLTKTITWTGEVSIIDQMGSTIDLEIRKSS